MVETKKRFDLINRIRLLIQDGFFHILLGNTLNKMVAFASSIVIVRLVTKADYAYLSYADNLYSYINLFAGLGVSTAILKFCSPEREKGINKYFFILAMKTGVVFQLIMSLILVVYSATQTIAFQEARFLILIMVLYPVFVQMETTIQSYVRSMFQNKLYAKMGVVQTVTAFTCSVIFVLLIGINGIVFARYLAITMAIGIAIPFLKTDLPAKIKTIIPTVKEKKYFWKISISLMLANLFSMVMPINEMFLINQLIRDEVMTANYKVAILIPSQITFIANSIIVYIFPKVARKNEKGENVFKYSLKVGMILLLLIFGVCLVGEILTAPVIRLVYGKQYEDAIALSNIYWIVYGLNAGLRMLPMNILPAMGVTYFNFILSVITCLVHAVLLYIFIEGYGIFGAAYALILVYLFSGFLYWIYLYKYCYGK